MKNQNIVVVLLAIVVFAIPSLSLSLIDGRDSFIVELTFSLIILQSAYFIFRQTGVGTTLFKMYFLFSYIFFGLAPFLQFKNEVAFFGAKLYGDDDYIITNILILMLNVVFYFAYRIFQHTRINKNRWLEVYQVSIELHRRSFKLNGMGNILIAVTVILSLAITIASQDFSITKLFYRGVLSEFQEFGITRMNVDKLGLVRDISIRVYPLICLVFALFYLQGSKGLKMFLFITSLLCAFPLAIPRYLTAAFYLPVLLLMVPAISKTVRFPLVLMFAVVYLFPFINQFRWYYESLEFKFGLDDSLFLAGHFDTYQSLLIVVSENIITYGYQLLGVLFFYVPRSVWPSKPIGSGAELADQMGLWFTNISANIYAEGYINFGVIGAVVICLFMAYAASRGDSDFWHVRRREKRIGIFRPLYLCTLGYSFFVLRGDLLSATAYYVAILLSFIVVHRIFKSNASKV